MGWRERAGFSPSERTPAANGNPECWAGRVRLILGVAVGLLVVSAIAYLVLARPPKAAIGPERYLAGYLQSDGHLIWQSYAPDAQEALKRRGQGEAETVAFYQWLATRPGTVEQVTYLGGFAGANGGTYQYRVAGHSADGSAYTQTWTFLTDRDGLVLSIE
jgi:hypothetical protein